MLIKKRNNKKLAGSDNIPNFILKKISGKFLLIMMILFNNLNLSYFPNEKEITKVIALHKRGKEKSDPENYRSEVPELFCPVDHLPIFSLTPS